TRSDIKKRSMRSRCSHPLSSSQTPHGHQDATRPRQTPATHGPMRQPAPQPPETTTPTPQPPPRNPQEKRGTRAETARGGLFPQDPTARRHPHPAHTSTPGPRREPKGGR